MLSDPITLRITGAMVLAGDGLRARPMAIAGGVIADVADPVAEFPDHFVLPGIVDLCAGPTAGDDGAIRRLGPGAAAAGVTTLRAALRWPGEGGAEALRRDALALAAGAGWRAIDLAPFMILPTGETAAEGIADMIGAAGVAGLLFDAGDEASLSPEAARALPRRLSRLADAAEKSALRLGSFDDRDGDTRHRLSILGARFAIAPRARSAAAVARASGEAVLAPAATALAPGPIPGRVATCDLIAQGLCNGLVSGGEGSDLATTAFALAASGRLGLAAAWRLISAAPAAAAGLRDRGRLAPGLRADLCVIDAASGRVAMTIAAGRIVHITPEAHARMAATLPQGCCPAG